MTEFVGLRPKTCFFLMYDARGDKKLREQRSI